MSNLFLSIFNFFSQRKSLLLLLFFSLLLLMGYFASRVNLQESITQMLPAGKDSKILTRFLGDSKFSDRIIIAVSQKDTMSTPDPDQLVTVADSFALSANENLNQYIENLNFVANDNDANELLGVIDENLPVFLDDADYQKINSLISDSGLKARVEENYKILSGPGGIGMKQFIIKDPLGLNFIGYKKLNSFQLDESVELYDGHYLTRNHYNLIMYINPKHPASATDINSKFFAGLDSIIHEKSISNPAVDIVYFGSPVVAAGNARQIRQDTSVTLTITIILLLLVVLLFFRRLTAPLLIITPVVFGGLFALSIIFFIKGSISVIAVGAGSLILGIAVNYSMHFLTHQRFHQDIHGTIKELAFPMTIGSLTTIAGFLGLQFVEAPVLQDLGLFAALSLAGAALATLIFLPHFVGRNNYDQESNSIERKSISGRIRWLIPSVRFRMIVIFILTPILFYYAKSVDFESDMYKINYMSPELKVSEQKMNKITSFYQKSVFTVTTGNSLEDALRTNEKLIPSLNALRSNGTIINYANVSTVLPSSVEQQRRIEKWNAYWSKEKADEVYSKLKLYGAEFNFKESAFMPVLDQTQKHYTVLSQESVSTLRNVLLNNFIEIKDGTWSLVGMIKTIPENSGKVYSTLSNFTGTITFDRKYITDKLMSIVNNNFNFITLWTSLLVFVALLLVYGRIELALISFIPMVISWIWILGMMSLLDIKFNVVNIVLSTFIFALGDDFCIFTTDGLQQEYARNIKNTKSLKISIALSAITTIIGMGVLIFAKHPALSSIALVSIIGILSVWVISQTLQPVLFRWLITNPTSKKQEPYTFFNILKSAFAFSYFIFGSLLISLIGIVLMKLIPVRSAQKKLVYHTILQKFAHSMIYIMSNVKKKIINEHKEDFSKPAVIIVNHSSFLDILLLIMLHPKMILLTNKWVWNSPFFGIAVRMAEYYPVSEGAENTTDQLKNKIAEGYSIVVFPEGTRSVDGTIGRFHKGAFFLAENLKIDILPIVIHGAAHTMTKGFFYLKNGSLTLNILPRIHPGEIQFGATYQEKAKQLRKYFVSQLNELTRTVETPEYYRDFLFSNFIYKGPVLEWYMKIKVRLEKNYKWFLNVLPEKGNILDIGCGYGFLAYMLKFTSPQRVITGIDYDEDKITIAAHGYEKRSGLNFFHGNAMTYDFGNQDAIILNDVLHYLPTPDQSLLIEKCIHALNDNGMIVIRDGIKELAGRHRGTWLSELFSTRLLGFNKTEKEGLHFISSQLIENVASKYGFSVSKTDTTRFTSNIIFVLQRKA